MKEKRSLLTSFLIGASVAGVGGLLPSLANGELNIWEVLAGAALGGVGGSAAVTFSGRPGSSDALIEIVEAADRIRGSSERLEGSLAVTQRRLVSQGDTTSNLKTVLDKFAGEVEQNTELIADFGNRLGRMAAANRPPISQPRWATPEQPAPIVPEMSNNPISGHNPEKKAAVEKRPLTYQSEPGPSVFSTRQPAFNTEPVGAGMGRATVDPDPDPYEREEVWES